MNQNEFNQLQKRRNDSMLELVWPKVKDRMMQGQTSIAIASEMSKEGYFGFTSDRFSVRDIRYLWDLSLKSRDELANEVGNAVAPEE